MTGLSEQAFDAAMKVYGIKRGGGIVETRATDVVKLNRSLANLFINIYRMNLMINSASEEDETKRFANAIKFYKGMQTVLEEVQADFLESLISGEFQGCMITIKKDTKD